MVPTLVCAQEGVSRSSQYKRTFAVQNAMSALHPIADMCGATRYVRFVPIADIYIAIFARSQRHND